MLPIFLGVLVGGFLPTQVAVNAKLRQYVLSPFVSSFISFSVGATFLFLLSIVLRNNILLTNEQLEAIPLWVYLGGLFGTICLTTNILLFPILGSVQTVIIPIMGQIIMSMLIDNFGWFGMPIVPLTVYSFIGICLLIVGVICVIVLPNYLKRSKLPNIENRNIPHKWFWQLLALGAGVTLAIQGAINGQLGIQLNSPIQASLISCAEGACILFVVVLIQRTLKNVTLLTKDKTPWYIYIGGILGALYVLVNALLVPTIGAGNVVVLTLLGQMIVSLFLEHFGILGAYVQRISNIKIIGVLLMIIGIYVIKM